MKNKTAPKPHKTADGFVAVAEVGELPEGTRKVVEVDEQPVALFNVKGQYYAIGHQCSHDVGPLGEGNLYGYEIECPSHGARFDIRTGKVLSFPAAADVAAYEIKVEGDKILLKRQTNR